MKAIFFDVDGTLLCRDGTIRKQTIHSLQQLKENNCLLFLATGRHTTELTHLLEIINIPFDGYVTLNGQLCLDSSFHIIKEEPISVSDKNILITFAVKNAFPIVIIEKDRLYINCIDEKVRFAQKAIHMPLPPIEAYHGDAIYQFTAFLDTVQTALLTKQLTHCKITRWNPYGIDIISNTGGKAKGIAAMLEHFHISKEDTISFGDGENDRDMLSYTQIGIAMQNADPALLQIADYITESAENDGIAKALKHFHLIK